MNREKAQFFLIAMLVVERIRSTFNSNLSSRWSWEFIMQIAIIEDADAAGVYLYTLGCFFGSCFYILFAFTY